jgi:hypothetical protein
MILVVSLIRCSLSAVTHPSDDLVLQFFTQGNKPCGIAAHTDNQGGIFVRILLRFEKILKRRGIALEYLSVSAYEGFQDGGNYVLICPAAVKIPHA